MSELSQASIKIPSINHACIVVKNDIEKIAENYWNILGIGPWDVFTIEPPIIYDESYHGKPASFGFRAALCQCGPCQLELIQALKGDSMYKDFLAERGEGLQHIMYSVNTIDEARNHVRLFAEQGFPLIMDAYLPDEYFAYVDTFAALKCVLEICKFPSSIPASIPHVHVPADENAVSPATIKVESIVQVASVVKDVHKTAETYWNILGIGPWDIYEIVPPALHGRNYQGKEGNFTYWLAMTMAGPVQLELAQPISGDSVYADFLAEHGEGLHHIAVKVDDIKETTKIMNQAGFSNLMSASLYDGGFAYYDTVKPLKCIIEAVQIPETLPPVRRYP
jgi:hypothetical protein